MALRLEGKATTEHFTRALSCFSRCSRWKEALSLLADMIKCRHPPPDVHCYNAVISACCRAGKWPEALPILESMEEEGVDPDMNCYNGIMLGLSKAGQWQLALRFLKEARRRGLEPDVYSYSSCVSACDKGGRWKEALQLLGDMEEGGVEPNVVIFGAALSACGRKGRWREAERLMASMVSRGLEMTPLTASGLIRAYGEAGKWEKSVEVLKSVRKPNVVNTNLALSALAKAGEWERALELLEDSPVSDVCSYNAVLDALQHSDDADLILELYRDLRRCARRPGQESFKYRPDAVTISCVVKGLYRCGRADLAMTAFDGALQEKRKLNLDTQSFNSALAACAEACDWQKALEYLSAMRLFPGANPDIVTYNTVMNALEASGKAAETLRILSAISEAGLSPDEYSFGAAIRSLMSLAPGMRQKACDRLLHLMREQGVSPGRFAQNAALRVYGSEGLVSKVHEVWSQVEERTEDAYAHVMEAFDLCGDIQGIREILAQAAQQGCATAKMYNCALNACTHAGDWDAAWDVRHNMQAAGVEADAFTYQALIGACTSTERPLDLALSLWKEMGAQGIKRTLATYHCMIAAYTHCT